MGSEQGPDEKRRQHIEAAGLFDRELDSLIYPITKEGLGQATKNYLIRAFGYSAVMAATRVRILDERRDLPQEREIEHDQESLSDMLKVGLFCELPEEYIILHGREEFDRWIGPYTRSALLGHVAESESYEHNNECPERFCSAVVLGRMFKDQLVNNIKAIHEGKAKNEVYLPYADDIVYMNIRIINELTSLGVYDETEAADILKRYQRWLDSIGDVPFEYDDSLFD